MSAVTAARARENARGRLRLVQADIRELPFSDDSFDLLYTIGTIEHIDEYQRAVDEVARVLRPGGRAVVGVPHKWDVFLRPVMVQLLELVGKYAYAPEKSFSAGELRRVVEAAGLRVRERTGILAIPGVVRMADLFLYRRRSALHRLTPLVLWPFAWAETRWRWPGYLGYLLALVVEKPARVRAAARARSEVKARPRAAATP